jgi:hypothetical protein
VKRVPSACRIVVASLATTLVFLPGAAGARPRPLLTTVTPLQASTVSGHITWRVSVSKGKPRRVDFAVDGVPRWTATTSPYLYGGRKGGFDTETLPNGSHRLTAIASSGKREWKTSITIKVSNDAVTRQSSAIYWGAYIEGSQTYGHVYGGNWGNAPWDAATWSRFESNAGKPVSIEHYGQPPPWEHAFDALPARLVHNRGAIPAIDMSTKDVPLREIASGTYDESIAEWAKAAKKWGRPFFLILDVEMNGGWEPYAPGVNGNTALDFVHAWRHMHDIFTAVGATNATWVWAPNVDRGNQFVPYDQLYPGDAYVDWTGLDGYDSDGASSFSSVFASSYEKLLALAPTKPIMITQSGAAESGAKAAWIDDALQKQLPHFFPGVKAFLWFNWRIYERGRWLDWEIESSPAAQAAFAAAISSAYYQPGGRVASLPVLSKVQPLP